MAQQCQQQSSSIQRAQKASTDAPNQAEEDYSKLSVMHKRYNFQA
jgi:hypothetical protein